MSDTPKIKAAVEITGWQEIDLAYERMASKGEEAFQRVDQAAKAGGETVKENVRTVSTYSNQVTVSLREQEAATTSVFEKMRIGAAAVADGIGAIATAAAVAGIGITAALGAGYIALENFADKTAKDTVAWVQMADAAGVTTDALSRYEYMAGVAAGSSNLVGGALKNVSDLLIRFRENAADESAVRPFRQLGLESELVAGKFKNAEDVFARVEEQLRLIPDSALRSKAAFDLFGSGAKELLPVFSKNATELANLKEEAKRFGETNRADLDLANTTKLLEDKNRLKLAIDDLKDAVGAAFFPVLAKGAGDTAKYLNENKEKITGYIEDFADKFGKLKDDFGKIFEAPKQDRRLNVEVNGRSIDFTKARLKELVEAARAGQIAVEGTAAEVRASLSRPIAGGAADMAGAKGGDDDEEKAGDKEVAAQATRAQELKSIRLSELYDYVTISGRKIEVDEAQHQSFVRIDGQRVAITRENSALILKGLADDAEAALQRQNASSASAVKLNFSFMRSLYGPAQELRAIALDLWDAIRGEGLGDRSKTIKVIADAWATATVYALQFRDAVLGVFGLTAKDLPTMGQAFDKVLASLRSFKMGLFGDTSKAEVPWAQSVGKSVAYLGGVLMSVWDVAKTIFGFLAPYVVGALNIVGDAFKALADYIKGNPIADDNTFAWVQKYIPNIEEFFSTAKGIVTSYVDQIKGYLKEMFKDVTWDDVKAAAKTTFDIIVAAAVIAYKTIAGTFKLLKKAFDVLITPIDLISKLLGFKGWETGLLTYLLVKLFLATTAGQLLLSLLGTIFWAILPGLIAGFIGLVVIVAAIVGVIAGLVALFGAVPLAIGAALAVLGTLAYKYSDQIKKAFGAAADWVVDKWTKLKGLVGGALRSVKKALGLGGDEPEAPAAPGDAPVGPAMEKVETKDRAVTQYVLGTDGQWRSAEEEEERTRPEWMRPKPPQGTVQMASYTSPTRSYDAATGRPIDDVVARQAMAPAVTGQSMLDKLSASLQELARGLDEKTPFTDRPPVVPEGKGGLAASGLSEISIEIDPNDKRLFGTPAAAKSLVDALQAAGISVRTPPPRTQ